MRRELLLPTTGDVLVCERPGVEREGLFLLRLRLLLSGQLHDDVVQVFRQALLVVVALLGWHIDGLQGGAIVKCCKYYAKAIIYEDEFLNSNTQGNWKSRACLTPEGKRC